MSVIRIRLNEVSYYRSALPYLNFFELVVQNVLLHKTTLIIFMMRNLNKLLIINNTNIC